MRLRSEEVVSEETYRFCSIGRGLIGTNCEGKGLAYAFTRLENENRELTLILTLCFSESWWRAREKYLFPRSWSVNS